MIIIFTVIIVMVGQCRGNGGSSTFKGTLGGCDSDHGPNNIGTGVKSDQKYLEIKRKSKKYPRNTQI